MDEERLQAAYSGELCVRTMDFAHHRQNVEIWVKGQEAHLRTFLDALHRGLRRFENVHGNGINALVDALSSFSDIPADEQQAMIGAMHRYLNSMPFVTELGKVVEQLRESFSTPALQIQHPWPSPSQKLARRSATRTST